MKTITIKSILWSCLFFFSFHHGFSQTQKATKEDKDKLSREFARIATGNSFSSIGNFASIGTGDKTLSASVFFLMDNYDIVNLKVSGGASEGIESIFKEGKLNSNLSFSLSYNIMLRKIKNESAVLTDGTKITSVNLEIESQHKKYQKQLLALLKNSNEKDYNKDLSEAIKVRDDLEKKKNAEKEDKKRKRLTAKLNAANRLITAIEERKFASDEKYNTIARNYKEVHEQKIKELELKKKNIKPKASSFSWISLGYEAKNDTFLLFDELIDPNKQLFKQSYTSQSLLFSYNHQSNARVDRDSNGKITKSTKKNREYFSIGGRLDVTNNLSGLTKVEIVDSQPFGTSGDREKVSKQNAFEGNYQEDLTNASIYLDYYRFLPENQGYAFHFNPKVLMRENFKPVSSLQVGILFPFKDLKKQNTVMNLEVFYRFNDVFNTTNSDNSILNRNTVGIQGTVPFNF